MDHNQLWKAALGQLELQISQGNFLTWFRDTKIKHIKARTATIETPSAFTHEWLSRKYHTPILQVLQDLDKSVKQVNFSIKSNTPHHPPIRRNSRIIAQKAPRPTAKTSPIPVPIARVINPLNKTLNSKYTFTSFVIGTNNEIAHAACQAVSSKPGEAYNPLFIYGGVGLGKTHLLHAIGNSISKNSPQKSILYASSEKFINDFVKAIRERSTPAFRDHYRNVDVLMLDDIQFLAGKTKTQEELFHTFNALQGTNKQIIMSSDRSPKTIPTFEERLRSRLVGGMLVDIRQPDYETRLAIIQEKTANFTIKIDPLSLAYIAKNIQQNVRELEGALNRVVAHCDLNKKKSSLEYTKKILESILDKPQSRSVDSNKIIKAVSLYYNISNDDLCGKCRKQEIVRPRQIAMYLLRKENNSSFPSIGDQFGGRDHTTAMHACEKIEKLLEHDEDLDRDINFIKERLYA